MLSSLEGKNDEKEVIVAILDEILRGNDGYVDGGEIAVGVIDS